MNELLIKTCTFMLFFIFFINLSFANESEEDKIEAEDVPILNAYRINPHPPTIDGDLDDAIWKSNYIEFARDFTQEEPDEGTAPSESTVVAIAYDDDAIYVAFWCYDSDPEQISRQLVRRDRHSESDNISVCIDAFHDHRTAYRFHVSAAGVQQDTRIFNDDRGDSSWDAVWSSGVKEQPWGWSAEMKIPYHCLRFAEKDEHIWGLNFTRYINRKDEYLKWSFVPTEKGGFVSNFGHLTNLHDIKPAKHMEILPYVVSSTKLSPKSAGNPDGRDFMRNTGFDMKYALTTNLIVDATFNPDFGQVELDEPVLNLSTYETFFPERRPFFLEGSDLFNTDFMLFYSRRIGRSPYQGVEDDDALYYTDYPDATTILGATKITGKIADKTSFAIINAVTQEESAEYAAEINVVQDSTWNGTNYDYETISADTVSRSGVVEPLANYSIFRVKQDLFERSTVGGMLTVASQEGVHPAMTGGIDWKMRTNNNLWLFRGHAIFSKLDSENTGYGFNAAFRKNSGKHFVGEIGMTIKSPELNISRLGFTPRVNSRRVFGWFQYRTTDDWWIVRNSYNNFNLSSAWNYDNLNYEKNFNFNTYIEFINSWSLGGGVGIQLEKFSDRETRGNGVWEWPDVPTYSWWASLRTDNRKKISFNFNPGGGTDRNGTWWANYFGVDVRPKSNMEFSLGVNYTVNRGVLRWVDNVDTLNSISGENETASLFGELDRDQIILQASASMVINKNLSIQLSAEGLASGLDYENYRYYLGGNQYSDPVDYNTDYNYSAINSMFLARWEYKPGSTLYLVWTRSRPELDDGQNNLDLSRDLRRMFSGGARNIFLVKASYWMNI